MQLHVGSWLFKKMRQSVFDFNSLALISQEAGVYLMHDAQGQVLYVGKAKNLRNRLRQYFSGQDTRSQLPFLLEKICDIETIVVQSEKEALLLENTLIKRHQPRYNILLKDDKGYISIKITTKHPYPMMQLVRYKGKTPKDGSYFGPYTSTQAARRAFDLISRLFPLRQCSDEEFARRQRPCILYQMKRCPAPCVHYCTKEAYQEHVNKAKALLLGKNRELVQLLKHDMQKASDLLEFEKANEYLKKIHWLEQVAEKQNVDAVSRPDADVIALYREGGLAVITTLYYRESKLIGTHHFLIEEPFQEDDELLSSYLVQHYLIESLPEEIIVAHEVWLHGAIQELLHEQRSWNGKLIVSPRKERLTMAQLSLANAKAYLSEAAQRKERTAAILLDLEEALHLRRYPKRIECFDNSHMAGEEKVAGMAVFVDGLKFAKEYRKWKIKTVEKADDYAMLQEVLKRRFHPEMNDRTAPDLIIIDGGKGHLRIALDTLSELGMVACDVIAVAKEEGRHDRGLTAEVVHTEADEQPISFTPHSKLLHFLQRVRDEAHRFAIAFHRARKMKSYHKSALDDITGIGPVKKKKLLRAFGSVQVIARMSRQDLMQVSGITENDAGEIYDYFHRLI